MNVYRIKYGFRVYKGRKNEINWYFVFKDCKEFFVSKVYKLYIKIIIYLFCVVRKRKICLLIINYVLGDMFCYFAYDILLDFCKNIVR